MKAQSDQTEFERLVRTHTTTLRRFCHQLAGPIDGDDLLQDTLTRALVNFPSLRDHDRFVPWCRQIARTTNIRRARSAKPTEPLVDIAGPGNPTDDLVDDMARRDEVAHVLAALPPRNRHVLTARAEGVAPDALAAEFGVSRPLVDTWFARSRQQARVLLQALRDGSGVASIGVAFGRLTHRAKVAVLGTAVVGAGVATVVLSSHLLVRTPDLPTPVTPAAAALSPRSTAPAPSAVSPTTAVAAAATLPGQGIPTRPTAAPTTTTPPAAARLFLFHPPLQVQHGATFQPISIILPLPILPIAFGADACPTLQKLLSSCPPLIAGIRLRIQPGS